MDSGHPEPLGPAKGESIASIKMSKKVWIALIALPFLLYGLTGGGCGAQRIPAALTPTERVLLAQPSLPYSVAVVSWKPGSRGQNASAYASPLTAALEGSNAFRSVERDVMSGQPAANLTATSTGDYCNTAVIPIYTILTLGIVPTIFTDTDCIGMVFRRNDVNAGRDSVVVHFQNSGRVVIGWVGMALGFFPGWTHGEARASRPYLDRLRIEILSHSDQIGALGRH